LKAKVTITRRAEIADPQGSSVLRALHDLGFDEVSSVRIDRTIQLEIEGADHGQAESRVEEMCMRLLANPVLEDFTAEVLS
jgi:phosphoribosylformylglycinamidine synthase